MFFRSGTYAAIVLGKLRKVASVSELVALIVGMREHRDGLVELPSQLRYVCRLLGLPDPAECGWGCLLSKSLIAEKYLLASALQELERGGVFHWSPSPMLLRNTRLILGVNDSSHVPVATTLLLTSLLPSLVVAGLMTGRSFACSSKLRWVEATFLCCFVMLSVVFRIL